MGVIIEEITDDGSFETQAASATGVQEIQEAAPGPESSETGAGSREALPDQTQQDNAVGSTDDQVNDRDMHVDHSLVLQAGAASCQCACVTVRHAGEHRPSRGPQK